jgi:hypothetical protein
MYQRISLRFIYELVPALAVPAERVLCVRKLARRDRSACVTFGVVRAPDDDNLDDLTFGGLDARHRDNTLMDLSGCPVRLHSLEDSAYPEGPQCSPPLLIKSGQDPAISLRIAIQSGWESTHPL